jgi:hypothetical protein
MHLFLLLLLLLFCVFIVGSPRSIVGHLSLSTCHKITGKTIVRSYIDFPFQEDKKKQWCDHLIKLSTPSLYKYFPCNGENDPLLAVFNANILNEQTNFPFRGAERVGEFSFEIDTSHVNDMMIQERQQLVHRELWSDGKVGDWQYSNCNEVGYHQANIEFFVEGTGYHQTLVTDIKLRKQQREEVLKNDNDDDDDSKQCNLAVAYTMEASQYMDLDELREAQPYSLVSVTAGSWSIDVEKPAEQSTRHMLILKTTTCPMKNESLLEYNLNTPIHYRYQSVSNHFDKAPSCLLPPQIFIQCQSVCGNDEQVPWKQIDNIIVEGSKSATTLVCRDVPVGNSKHGSFVAFVTAFSTFAGAVVIIFSMKV